MSADHHDLQRFVQAQAGVYDGATSRLRESAFADYTTRALLCRLDRMPKSSNRVNVVLDDQHAAKLRRLAERANANPGTIARSLLSTALDDVDPDARTVTEVLDGIPGAFERAERGSTEAAAGLGVHLEDL